MEGVKTKRKQQIENVKIKKERGSDANTISCIIYTQCILLFILSDFLSALIEED